MNQYLGKTLTLQCTGKIFCTHCGKGTKKSFAQGYCYPCFIKLAQCDSCVMSPEKCHYAQGTCREPAWGDSHCNIDHCVYLANSSGIKVGITRMTQIPVRWIDQGASFAVPLFKVKTRHISGLLEVAIKQFVPDRTQWQRMLKGEVEAIDLEQARFDIFEKVKSEALLHQAEFLQNETVRTFIYPVLEYPKKVTSFSFDKELKVEGTLMGIKGQYLIFDTGVINVRKFTGYQLTMNRL